MVRQSLKYSHRSTDTALTATIYTYSSGEAVVELEIIRMKIAPAVGQSEIMAIKF